MDLLGINNSTFWCSAWIGPSLRLNEYETTGQDIPKGNWPVEQQSTSDNHLDHFIFDRLWENIYEVKDCSAMRQ